MGEETIAKPNVVANLVDEQPRELGIELRARTAGELLKRPLDCARRLIRAWMGHRVERVGDPDDPRLQRDALPAQSVWFGSCRLLQIADKRATLTALVTSDGDRAPAAGPKEAQPCDHSRNRRSACWTRRLSAS